MVSGVGRCHSDVDVLLDAIESWATPPGQKRKQSKPEPKLRISVSALWAPSFAESGINNVTLRRDIAEACARERDYFEALFAWLVLSYSDDPHSLQNKKDGGVMILRGGADQLLWWRTILCAERCGFIKIFPIDAIRHVEWVSEDAIASIMKAMGHPTETWPRLIHLPAEAIMGETGGLWAYLFC